MFHLLKKKNKKSVNRKTINQLQHRKCMTKALTCSMFYDRKEK